MSLVVAGVLPLGLAVEKSGAAQLLAQSTPGLAGPFGPVVVLAVLYLLTEILTEFFGRKRFTAPPWKLECG